MTIYTPQLVHRNATFAANGAFKGLPFPTNPALRVIVCVDSRVDPSDVLGLNLRKRPIVLGSWPGDGSRNRCAAGSPDVPHPVNGQRPGGRAVPTNAELRG